MSIKFNPNDKIMSIPNNYEATVIKYLDNNIYEVNIYSLGIGIKQIHDSTWEKSESPLFFRKGERVRYVKTNNIGTIINPAINYGLRYSILTVKGSMSAPEPIYFIDIEGDVDYKTKNDELKIVDARHLQRIYP